MVKSVATQPLQKHDSWGARSSVHRRNAGRGRSFVLCYSYVFVLHRVWIMNRQNENPGETSHMQAGASAGRRRCLQWIAASIALGSSRVGWTEMTPQERATNSGTTAQLNVAAIQMAPKLGDVEANLAQAEQLVRNAIRRGAEWILLPEMFTLAAAFHQDMVRAIRPLDGAPAKLLTDLARKEHVSVGGSFLAHDGDQVINAFLSAFPDGSTQRHDKDRPTYWETCYYTGGSDDGVLPTPVGPVGAALCWEMVRSGTVKRLSGKIRLLLAGSTWWTLALPENPTPAEAIPERFWIPEQMPEEWKEAWTRWFPRGEDYYKTVTLPYLMTGELEEYLPSYLRE